MPLCPARTRVFAALSSSPLVCLLLVLPASARAYCRSSDQVGSYGECVPAPQVPFLFWQRTCAAYSFNQDLFANIKLSESQVRQSFSAAFETWAAVDCSGRAPFFVEQRAQATSVDQSGYMVDKPAQNQSVILAIDAARWSTLPDHSDRAIAITLIWHNKRSGEIVDWDMELNMGAGQFADCVAHSCQLGMVDLQNTITHEAGHVLGLGHSTDPSSTMAAQTVGEVDTQKRSLAPDDEAGYCALMLPESPCHGDGCECTAAVSGAPAEESGSESVAAEKSGKCQLLRPGASAGSPLWLLLWAALAAARVVRRSRS